MKRRNTIHFTSYIILLLSSLPSPNLAAPSIPAIFAFGDSTIDPGNNNHIGTLFRSDHLPYGRDLSQHPPTGRFTDGKLPTDYLASALTIKELLPAYLDSNLTDDDLVTGVSFGSAGTGLDPRTANLSKVLDMWRQLDYFDEATARIRTVVGEEKAGEIVEKSLFLISVVSNDMLYNLYLPSTRMIPLSVSGYHDFLLQKLEAVVQSLYKRGARTFMVVGAPPIGCLPLLVTVESPIPSPLTLQRPCNDKHNADTQAYNTKLQALTVKLQATLPATQLVYQDIYASIMDMIVHPVKYGFEETTHGCCGTGFMEMGPTCDVLTPTCSDASKFLFWDAVHLSQAAYTILGANAADAVRSNIA